MTPGKTLFHNGEISFTTVHTDYGEKPLVLYPPASAVVAFRTNGGGEKKIILVEQHRIGAGRRSLEIPAGKSKSEESPLACARRELEEETGYQAGVLTPVMQYYPAIGICTELLYIFHAENLTKGESNPDDDEKDIVIKEYTLPEMQKSIDEQEIIDGKTIIAFLLWQSGKFNIE